MTHPSLLSLAHSLRKYILKASWALRSHLHILGASPHGLTFGTLINHTSHKQSIAFVVRATRARHGAVRPRGRGMNVSRDHGGNWGC